jgi:starvation-inducible DNA-binding protein
MCTSSKEKVMSSKKSSAVVAAKTGKAVPSKAAPNIHIGISDKARKEIAEGLAHVQAETATLYLKTHNFHWNVTGPMFNTLHLMFEEQYNELWLAVDAIAERMRALGSYAPGSYKAYAKLATIPEAEGVPTAEEMIQQLVDGHETVVRVIRTIVTVADNAKDESTADLLTQRLQIHEKTAWMLRSLLG